jgi:hypothetical protein
MGVLWHCNTEKLNIMTLKPIKNEEQYETILAWVDTQFDLAVAFGKSGKKASTDGYFADKGIRRCALSHSNQPVTQFVKNLLLL